MRTSKRNAISPILATIILIAITIAGGLLVYNVFFASSGTASKTAQIQITYVSMALSGSNYILTLQLKNSGSTPLPVGSNLNTAVLLNGVDLVSGTSGAFATSASQSIQPSGLAGSNLQPGSSMVLTESGAPTSGFSPAIGGSVSVTVVLGSATAQTSVVVSS